MQELVRFCACYRIK